MIIDKLTKLVNSCRKQLCRSAKGHPDKGARSATVPCSVGHSGLRLQACMDTKIQNRKIFLLQMPRHFKPVHKRKDVGSRA